MDLLKKFFSCTYSLRNDMYNCMICWCYMVKQALKNVNIRTVLAFSRLWFLHHWLNAGETTIGFAGKAH